MSASPAPQRRYAPRLPPEERREQLLDAALELIAAEGYGGVSMEAVARACGVTKPVVYELFANAGELARALLKREEDRALAELARAVPTLDAGAAVETVVADGLGAFLRAVQANPARWRLILMPTDGTPGMVRDHVARGRQTVASRLEALVRLGVEQWEGPADLDVELAAQAIMALAESAARLVLTDPDRYTPQRLQEFSTLLIARLAR
jgi:AcrR family transcriptional regulator